MRGRAIKRLPRLTLDAVTLGKDARDLSDVELVTAYRGEVSSTDRLEELRTELLWRLGATHRRTARQITPEELREEERARQVASCTHPPELRVRVGIEQEQCGTCGRVRSWCGGFVGWGQWKREGDLGVASSEDHDDPHEEEAEAARRR